MFLVSAWLMNRWLGQVTSESNDTTLMPAGLSLAQRGAQGGRVVARDDDGVGVRLDRRLDRRDLGGRGVLGAAADDDLAAELREGVRAALVRDDLVGVVRVLGDEVDRSAPS